MNNLGRFMHDGGAIPLKGKYVRNLVVDDKLEGRLNMCVPDGEVVSFTNYRFNVKYRVDKCHAFPSVTAALQHFGFRRLVPDANSLEEALVVYHKIAIYEKAARHKALAQPCTPAAIHAATKWDSEIATSNSVMFVWEGKVVHVPPGLRVKKGKFLPSHYVARVNDPRPGLLVIGMNFHDPSILSNRDGLCMQEFPSLRTQEFPSLPTSPPPGRPRYRSRPARHNGGRSRQANT